MKAQINTEPSMVNGLHLYSTFPVTYSHPKRFTLLPHIHSHTDSGVDHARLQPARREHLGLGALLMDTSTLS